MCHSIHRKSVQKVSCFCRSNTYQLQVSNTYQHQEINKVLISSPPFLIFLSILRFPGVLASPLGDARKHHWTLGACMFHGLRRLGPPRPWPPVDSRFEKNIRISIIMAASTSALNRRNLSLSLKVPHCETIIIIKTPSPCCEQVHHAATFFFPPCAGEASRFILGSMQDIRFAWSSKGAQGTDHFLKRRAKDSQPHKKQS